MCVYTYRDIYPQDIVVMMFKFYLILEFTIFYKITVLYI